MTPHTRIRRRNMPSSGTGSDISREDAGDLLSKLITESTKLQALFVAPGGFSAGVQGILRAAPGGLLGVKFGEAVGEPFLIFDPRLATSFNFAAGRAIPPNTVADAPRFVSSLILIYPDGSKIMLLEIESEEV
jgi:hypothetical protein